MTRRPAKPDRTNRTRTLRARQTKPESLIWTVLRGKRLGGLKWRRQHPIGPFFVDFACIDVMAIVDLDGGYHEDQYEADIRRQAYLESLGWTVMRFGNEDVLADVEAIATSIARQLDVELLPTKGVGDGVEDPSP